jgi:hypothetical protein
MITFAVAGLVFVGTSIVLGTWRWTAIRRLDQELRGLSPEGM